MTKYDEEARVDIGKIQQDYQTNKRQVIRLLMDQIMNVNLEVPKVVRKQYE